MLGNKVIIGAFAAALAVGVSAPAKAQGFCQGQLGGALCGAGIGGGIGAALGGKKGAQTGAIIGGVGGLLTTPPQPTYAAPPPAPVYVQPAPVYVTPAPPPPRYTYRRTYEPAYPSELVWSIQSGLHQLGYNPGPVDGAYGSNTSGAIRDYQRDNGLLVDGKPSQELYAHMQQYL